MVHVFIFEPVKIPSMTPTLGRAELLSKLLSSADTPKSFRSRSSRADSVTHARPGHSVRRAAVFNIHGPKCF